MWKDPIVEEVHKYRNEYAKKFNYDLHAICKDLKKKEKKSNREVISFPPKPVAATKKSGQQIRKVQQ